MESSMNKNAVQYLIHNPFSTLTYEEQIEIKELGRPTPDLKGLVSKSSKGNKEYTRRFHTDSYEKHTWLCGCEVEQAVFCFPCLCFGNETSWTNSGVRHLGHLSTKIKKHENSFDHLQNVVNLKVLGNDNYDDKADELDVIQRNVIQLPNEQIEKNRYILRKYLECVQFCGKHNLPMKNSGDNDTMTSENNYGLFQDAVELCKGCDVSLRCYLENSTSVNWTSMTIYYDLLDCMFLVARQNILSEMEMVQFVSIIVDGRPHVSSTVHLVILFRYELKGKPVERFWGVLNAANGHDAGSLSQTIMSEVNSILVDAPYKVVSQSYGGAAVMTKVNVEVKEMYPYAYYMHCHMHQLHVEMIQSVSGNKEVEMFFSDLSDITEFFSSSPQWVAVLDGITVNFTGTSGTLITVYMYRNEIMRCMDVIMETSKQKSTIKQAGSIKRILTDSVFVVWLGVFYEIMPNVYSLHDSVQTAALDNTADERVSILVQQFVKQISDVRSLVPNIVEISSNFPDVNVKRKRKNNVNNNYYDNESRKQSAIDICNTLIDTTKDRLKFTKHLTAMKLFQAEKYPVYTKKFPIQLLQCTFSCYPFVDKDRLKSELSVMYFRDDFRTLSGIIPTYQYILKNDMIDTFKEVTLLIRILITVPPMTTGQENSFSTLKRIKTFLGNTMVEEKLNALAMLNIENKMISDDTDFNKKTSLLYFSCIE
ncbi:uncharacterized protein LOC132940138 [Metopolophium dirhodum]|uniref:uncharacterized protein LOC132940138 n=1 Tax=Metopolophium dirhodum TaxID=44670 RepID=UPI00299062C1|nr:uncharacterized protein LOC132940138 [Metopolophium dirhodum]